MRRYLLPAAWILAALAVLLLGPGCASIPIDPDTAGQAICMATCNGECQRIQGVWRCVPQDPCQGKAPICERNDDTDCWAKTPDGKCTWFPKPAPEPTPVPTPEPTPTPTPTPTPQPGCNDEQELEGVACSGPRHLADVKRATDALGDRTGRPPKENLEAVAAKLREQTGRCVIAGIEAVFIKRDDGSYEENHVVYFGNGSWTGSGNGKFMGCHRVPGASSACPAPVPPRVWTADTLPPNWGENAIGTARWELKCKPHGPRLVDCTPVVAPWACGYCSSIGMGEMSPGVARCGCPVRPDGHPDRAACEEVLTGGLRLEGRNGAECEATDNPFQFVVSGGNCRLCSMGEPEVCGGWF